VCTITATSWRVGLRRCRWGRGKVHRPNLGIDTASIPRGSQAGPEAVLVFSPHAGNSRRLGRARRALNRHGVQVAEELAIQDVARLPDLPRDTAGQPRLLIVAGGDGTVGSVAGYLAGADNTLGILPLGTGNDFARSVGIPINPRRAAKTVASGEVSHVDLSCLTRPHLGADTLRPCRHGRTQR
jgi:diacylglycerol kinase (ATP)